MVAELSMNQIIHAAVRRDVARTERALRAMTAGDADRVKRIQRGWAHLVAQLSEHHQQEDAWVWPYLRTQDVEPALLDTMESEHQDLGAALRSGTKALESVAAEPTHQNASAAADTIAEAGRVVGGHLDHEERDIEPVIRALSEEPGWKAVEKKFRQGGPTRAGAMMAWLQDGAGQRERTALKQTIPAPVVFMLARIGGRGYTRDVAPVWRD